MELNVEEHAGPSALKQRLDENHDRSFMTCADNFEVLVNERDAESNVHT